MNLWKKSISLLLALVMVCTLFSPAITVRAAENTVKTGRFYYAGIDKEDHAATFFYDDGYFSQSAYTYQDSLATMSMCLAMSAFASYQVPNDAEGYRLKSQNLQQLLADCGFPQAHFAVNEGFLTKPTEDSIGVGASHKSITVNGECFTLLAVAIRGACYESEWASNFTLGKAGDHQGFAEARDQVLAFLKAYVADQEISGPVKLWITGYSRAAITANMTAAALDEGYLLSEQLQLAPADIYAYCFECPQGTVSGDAGSERYQNIFSIINPADVVTKIAPTLPRRFGFHRYGVSRYLPTALKSGEAYPALLSAMLEKYSTMPGAGEYIVDDFQMKRIAAENLAWEPEDLEEEGLIVDDDDASWDQNAFLDETIYRLFLENIRSRQNFVSQYQDDFRELSWIIFGNEDKWGAFGEIFLDNLETEIASIAVCLVLNLQSRLLSIVLDAAVEALNEAGISDYSTEQVESFVNKIVQMLLQFGVLHPDLTVTTIANLEGLAAAHYPELCFAWLQSFDPNYTPAGTAAFNSGVHRVVRINCPVDVYVYDAEDALVAAIVGEQPQNTPGSSIVSYINEQEEKLVYLPADAGYRVELMAAGTGTMNVAIQEFSEAAGGVNRLLHFCNLPLAEGAVYTCTIPAIAESELSGGCLTGSTASHRLTDATGNTIQPDTELSGEAASNANFSVTVTSNDESYGAVTGAGTFRQGEYAKLTAFPTEGCRFIGWYAGESLLSTDAEYRFCVTADAEIQGVFRNEARAVTRIAGTNRYETAEKAADALKAQLGVASFDHILIASGLQFADALSGSYLASVKRAPILLVDPSSVEQVAAYVKKNLTDGGTVYLLGGTAAFPAAMEEALAGLNLKRLSGADRYTTNLAILEEAGVEDQEILVCTGSGFADSLSASATGLPVLLSGQGLTPAQKEFLAETSGKFIIIGGTGAVDAKLEAELTTFGSVERLSGADRYATSVLVAKRFFEAPVKLVLAYAQNFPDGLCSGPLAAQLGAPLILVAPGADAPASAYRAEQGITCGYVLGGKSLIPDSCVRTVFSLSDTDPIIAN